MRVLVFGGSITQGFWDSKGGWVARLAKSYTPHTLKDLAGEWTLFFNLGVSGNTIKDVEARLENEARARIWKNQTSVIILSTGINDAVLINNRVGMETDEFQKKYYGLIDTAKKVSDKVLCVGLSAVDQELTNPWQLGDGHEQWLNNRIDLFEDTIKQSAKRREVPFVPIYDKYREMMAKGKKMHSDGLHPNDAGHELIAELVKPEIEKLLV
jgi:lysophospholipase L1-like esterase